LGHEKSDAAADNAYRAPILGNGLASMEITDLACDEELKPGGKESISLVPK